LLGSAQAGMMTEAGNASLIVNNPASLGWGNGREVVFGGTPIFTAAHFHDGVADTLLGTPISGGDGGNNGTKAFLPNLYAATDLAPEVRIGLGVTSLYGLGSTWQPGWLGQSNEFQHCEAGNPAIWLRTEAVAIEFRCSAPR